MRTINELGMLIGVLLFVNTPALCQNVPTNNISIPGNVTLRALPGTLTAPNNAYNFVRTWIPQTPTQVITNLSLDAPSDILISTTYTDGMGKPLMINLRGTPNSPDIIQPFDNRASLESTSYLPYSATYKSKFQSTPFLDQKNYYLNSGYNVEAGTSYTLTKPTYVNGTTVVHTYKPGKAFVGQFRGTDIQARFNTVADDIKIIDVDASSDNPVVTGVYAEGKLTVKVTTDALTANSSSYVQEFFDDKEQLICKKVTTNNTYLTTYYVYNDIGKIRFIIPPQAVNLLVQNNWSFLSNPILATYCHKYVYNNNGNVIEKITPDRNGIEVTVYDKFNRPVLFQSPLMHTQNKWAFTIYDTRDRAVMSGVIDNNNFPTYGVFTREDWQTEIDGGTAVSNPQTIAEYLIAGFIQGNAYPASIPNCEIDVYNYYDKYDSYIDANNPDASQPVKAFDWSFSSDYRSNVGDIIPNPYTFTIGQLTASKTRVIDGTSLGLNTWISRVYYYDQKGNLIQASVLNPFNPTNWDVTTIQYNFTGKPINTITQHFANNTNKPATKIITQNFYNSSTGRLTEIKQKVDNGAFRRLAFYQYDNLGKLVNKSIGDVETQLYSYNLQGQLTGINADYLDAPNPSVSFMESLSYNTGFTTARYDGRISGFIWKTKSTPKSAYGYSYDDAGRLIGADYRDYSAIGTAPGSSKTWNKVLRDFTVGNLSYDMNGNMLTMQQYGFDQTFAPAIIDDLSYSYIGNKLQKVTDAGVNSPSIDDFDNGNTGTNTDYTYDDNGNLASDANKNVASITYNHFDLPLNVTTNQNSTITNTYDGVGNLIAKKIVDANTGTTTNYRYWREFTYKYNTNNATWELESMLHQEGRSRWIADSSLFKHDFFIKDHLGNVRVVLTSDEYTGTQQYVATHELLAATAEGIVFTNMDNVRDTKPEGNPWDLRAARLNGNETNTTIGTTLAIKVMAGDKLKVNSFGYYEDNGDNSLQVTAEDMATAIIQSLTGGSQSIEGIEGGTEDMFGRMFSEENYISLYNGLKEAATNSNLPRAYLNYLLFDEDMNLVADQSGAFQVGDGTNTWSEIGMANFLEVAQNGYLVVYLSNEQHVDVFFDDLHVTHVRGRLMEEQHYYPHGLLINKTIAAGAIPENKYQFEGKKMQDEIGLKLYDFHARQYDPQIGRFWGVDPANQFPSGYTGIGNDPANLTDPTGMQVGGGGGGSPLGIEASSDAEARKNYVDRGRRAEKFQLYVDGQFAGWENWENIPFIGVGTPTVDLSQGVTLTTKNVGGKAIQGYWRNTNRTDYTQSGLSTMDGKYTEMGLSIVALKFIPFGYGAQSNRGSGWDAANTTLGAFGLASGIKETIIEGGAALNRGTRIYNVNSTSLIRTYGVSGAKYLKYSKALGVVGSVVSTTYSGYKTVQQYRQGGMSEVFQHRDIWDAGVGAAGVGAALMLSNPVGWGIGIGVLIYGGATLIYDAVNND